MILQLWRGIADLRAWTTKPKSFSRRKVETKGTTRFLRHKNLTARQETNQAESVALNNNYANVTVNEAKTMLDTDLHLVVLDVRTPAEYSLGHLRNAKLIPLDKLVERQEELSKSDTILVYCRLSVRSRRASQILASNNFLRVHNMLGGITAWTGAGFPVYSQQSSFKQAIARMRARFRQLLFRSVF